MAKAKRRSRFEKIRDNVTKISGFMSAIIIIVSSAAGLCTWTSEQLTNAIGSQIDDLRQEMIDTNRRTEQSVARTELLILMEHDPQNTVAIEKMARHYFGELNGDLYMTKEYSKWAKANGGDISIILGVD